MNNVYVLFCENNIVSVYELKEDAIRDSIEDIKCMFSDDLEAQEYEVNAFLEENSSFYIVDEFPFISK